MNFDVDSMIDRLLSVGLKGGVPLTKCVKESEIGLNTLISSSASDQI